jgi:hypothetical protein
MRFKNGRFGFALFAFLLRLFFSPRVRVRFFFFVLLRNIILYDVDMF